MKLFLATMAVIIGGLIATYIASAAAWMHGVNKYHTYQ